LARSTLYHRRLAARGAPLVAASIGSMIYVLIAASYTPFRHARAARQPSRPSSCWWSSGLAPAGGVTLQLAWPRAPQWVLSSRLGSRSAGSSWITLDAAAAHDRLVGDRELRAERACLYTPAPSSTRERPNRRPGRVRLHELFHALVLAAAAIHYAVVAFVVLPLRLRWAGADRADRR